MPYTIDPNQNVLPGVNAFEGYNPSAAYFYLPAGSPSRGDLLGAPITKGNWVDVAGIRNPLQRILDPQQRWMNDPSAFMPWYMNTILSDPAYTSEGIYRQYALENGLRDIESHYNQLAGATPFGASANPLAVRQYYNYINLGFSPQEAAMKAGNAPAWSPPSVPAGQPNPSMSGWAAGEGRAEAEALMPYENYAKGAAARALGAGQTLPTSAPYTPTSNQTGIASNGPSLTNIMNISPNRYANPTYAPYRPTPELTKFNYSSPYRGYSSGYGGGLSEVLRRMRGSGYRS